MNMPKAVHMLSKDIKGPKLQHLAELEALHKQEVKDEVELSTAWLNVESLYTQRATQHVLGDLLAPCFYFFI